MVLDTLCIQFTPHSYNSKDIFKSKETVLVKTHQLEIMHVEIGEEGPRLVPHPSIPVIPIRGRIVAVRAVRNGHLPLNNDSLLVTTESERLLLISCDKSCSLSVTEIDIHDPACRPIEAGLLIATNNSESRYSKHLKKTESINLRSSSRTINSTGYKKSTVIENHLLAVLHTVQGLLKIIHIDIVTGQLIQRNERIEELSVLDMVMLDDESICLLYETAEGGRAIRNYSINLTTIEPKPIFDDLEPDSYQILSAVDGGILVLGVGTIFYWSSLPGRHSAIATKSMKIACTSIIEDHSKNDIAQLKSESKDISSIQNIGSKNQNETFRILLADADGEIHLLVLIPTLNTQDGPVFRLQLQSLGYSICPSGISYVRDGLLIVSGRQKSYMLYQLSTDRLQNGTFLLPLSSYTSVKGDISNPSAFEGPIIDMATVPETASTCIASCVGFGSEGGLQITRKGALIEIDIELDFEMPILKLFLRPNMIFVVSPFTTSVLSVSFNS